MESNLPEYDYLNFNDDKDIRKIIGDEKLLFSDKIIKINRYSISQERNLVITNKAVYNFKKKAVKRRIPIEILLGITISEETDEFVIHGNENEYDYDYISQKKLEIISIIANVYSKLTNKKILFSKIKDTSLKKYVTTKKEKRINPSYTKMNKNLLFNINEFLNSDPFNQNINLINNNDDDILSKENSIKTNSLSSNGSNDGKVRRTSTIYSSHKTIKVVTLEDFKVLKVIGRGSFGKVCMVEHKPTKEIYAMKSLKKDILIEQEQIENTLLEKEILETINHPLLCGLVFCFQTEERIYFIMPFINGGELFQHLRKFRTFDEGKVRFYGAQIAIALQYLHDKGIIYRDLKPENILMDDKGYLKLTDFGMAKKLKENEKAMTFCGTPEYLAPEIIDCKGHDKDVDWWSFGILLYEMLCGLPPFYVENIDRMYELIRSAPLKFPRKIVLTEDAKDIIIKLLDRNPKTRLGHENGIKEIENHPFFQPIDFDKIVKKKIPAPFIPNISNSTDVGNFDEEFTNEDVSSSSYIPQQNIEMIKLNQNKFKNFDH